MAPARPLLRALPSLVVGVLVVAAAAAQSGASNPFRLLMPARTGPFAAAASGTASPAGERVAAPAAANATVCRAVSASATTVPPVAGARIVQPDVVTITASSLAFTVANGSGAAITLTAELGFSPPSSTIEPPIESYPLFRGTLTASGAGEEALSLPLDRAIVVRTQDPTARTWTAELSYRTEPTDQIEVSFEPEGPPQYRAASFDMGQGAVLPLPGGHPVLAHEVCGGAEGDGGLAVAREVLRVSEAVTFTADLVQTFSCPVTFTADWVELALASPPAAGSPPLAVSIIDMQGVVEPPLDPVTITATWLDASARHTPVWVPTHPVTITVTLEAGRRYGLMVTTSQPWSGGAARAPDGAEYPGGELWVRGDPLAGYALEPDLDLSFRLIGTAVTVTAAPPVCDAPALSSAVTVTANQTIPPDARLVQPLTIRGSEFAIGRVSWSGDGQHVSGTASGLHVLSSPPGQPPSPTRIALRAPDGGPVTETACCWSSMEMAVPLVTRPVSGVAQGRDDDFLLAFRGAVGPVSQTVLGYDEASVSGLPPAMLDDGSGLWQPLPGTSPVLAHVVCPTTQTADPWRVVQQVLEAGHIFAPTATAELLQTFRVAAPVTLAWAELGAAPTGTAALNPVPFDVSLVAPTGTAALPATGWLLGGSLVHPTLTAMPPSLEMALRPLSAWSQAVTLTPGVDYAFYVTHTADWDLAHSEGSTYAEGRIHRNPGGGLPSVEETDRDLAFRLIGVPRALVALPVTPTCDGCEDLLFTSVTTTAGFADDAGPRDFAQIVSPTWTPVLGSLKLAAGTDGGAVTVTVRMGLADASPTGAVPSSATYPLTNVTITAQAGDMDWGEASFDRPLVLRSSSGPITYSPSLAVVVPRPPESAPGRAKVAMGAEARTFTAGLVSKGSAWSPLPGLSLGHVLLPTTRTADEDLSVVVSELSVHGVTITAQEVVQVFRVPAACSAEWVELAVPEGQAPAPPFMVSIVDPQGLTAPPDGELQGVTVTAQFPPRASMSLGSTWAPSEPLAQPVALEPGRDYWLVTLVPAEWRVASAVTVTASGVGVRYSRAPGTFTWTQVGGPMAFRLVGKSSGTTDAPLATPSRAFMLSAHPSPFSRELALRWSGGVGRARVEVFDAGGRRVRLVRDAGLAAHGAWTWRGEDDGGRAVRAGVYFARVTPENGPALHRRVVFLR